MVITDNSPGAGFVAWSGMVINFKGSDYNITNGNSNKIFLWWDFTSPTVLEETDTLPTMTDDDSIILLNVSGIHTLVPTATKYSGLLLLDAAIIAAKLATDAVETAKIKNLNVTAAKLATDAVETAKIKDLNVTTDKVADNAITNAKLARQIFVQAGEPAGASDGDLWFDT